MMIKKRKGFTLVETLLVIGAISLATVKIFSVFQEESIRKNADIQVQMIEQIVNGVNGKTSDITIGTANLATQVAKITALTTSANLINEGLIPGRMRNGANIVSIWGGPVTLTGIAIDTTQDAIANPSAGFSMTFAGVSRKSCSSMITNEKLNLLVQSTIVNGATVRVPGITVLDGAAVAACNSEAANIITLSFDTLRPMKYDSSLDIINNITGPNIARAKEDKYYIGTAGTNTNTSFIPGCPSGSFWNSTNSSCVCPSGTQWVGNACINQGIAASGFAGICPLGQGWNQFSRVCQALPFRSGGTITNTSIGVNATFNGIPAGSYLVGNRMVPSTVSTAAQIFNADFNTQQACGTIPGAVWDGKICQVCARGSWQVDRCVTP